MPTYEYTCRDCGEHLEAVQSFHDDPLTTCPRCSGELRKVFGAVGIVFKGSGFYKTDNRSSSTRSSGSDTSSSSTTSASSSTTTTESTSSSSSTPAASSSTAAAPATPTP